MKWYALLIIAALVNLSGISPAQSGDRSYDQSEGQRCPDLGNGMYQNPIMGGDYPDPSVLRVGDDFYMTHSSFEYSPGLLIWHSKDLVNWEPVCNALNEYIGSVFAPDFIQYGDTFYIYFWDKEESLR